jgi:putative ABC transport system permease protein
MRQLELVRFVISALRGQRLRSFLSGLGVAIGVAAVVVLTSLGEGARQYVMSQFTQFGTNLMAVNPGRVKTMGMPGVLGGTTHKLSIDDAIAIGRLADVERVVPVVTGQGEGD